MKYKEIMENLELSRNDLLAALGFILIVNRAAPLREVWNRAYPGDYMDADHEAFIVMDNVFQVEHFQIHSQDDVSLVLVLLDEQGLGVLVKESCDELGIEL